MRNLKFGAFVLGLAAVIGIAVTGLRAQDRSRVEVRQAPRAPSTRVPPAAPDARSLRTGNLMMLDGRGSQLGVMVSDVDAKEGAGVKIDEVTTDSAAEKAGLKAGDVVVEFDGERVRSARQFTRLVQETPDGRTVKIAVLRDGKRQTLDATPEARSSWGVDVDGDRIRREIERGMRQIPDRFAYRIPEMIPGIRMGGRGRLGVTVESLSPQLAEYFGVQDGGALVSSVTQGSAAEKAGLKAGDVITSVNGGRVRDAESLSREIGDATGTELSIGVVRDKKETTLKATIESRRPDRPRANSRPGLRL
jgi:serine protease Do